MLCRAKSLKGHASKTEEELIEKPHEARALLDEVIDRGKHFATEKRPDVEAAVRADTEAVKNSSEQCCS